MYDMSIFPERFPAEMTWREVAAEVRRVISESLRVGSPHGLQYNGWGVLGCVDYGPAPEHRGLRVPISRGNIWFPGKLHPVGCHPGPAYSRPSVEDPWTFIPEAAP